MKTANQMDSDWYSNADKYQTKIVTNNLYVNTQTTGIREYILRGYNKYGIHGDCTIRIAVCGFEDIAPKAAYKTAAYEFTTTGKGTQVLDKATIFNSN